MIIDLAAYICVGDSIKEWQRKRKRDRQEGRSENDCECEYVCVFRSYLESPHSHARREYLIGAQIYGLRFNMIQQMCMQINSNRSVNNKFSANLELIRKMANFMPQNR